jgi:transcriptional regulator with XRE-family HTH domain
MTFGDRLRALRLERGMTQREMAVRCDVTVATVSNWETGRARPWPKTQAAIFSLLGSRGARLIDNV